MADTRIIYGAARFCFWWDGIDKIGRRPSAPGTHALPCCPHCGGMLFEMPNEQAWFSGVDRYEAAGHPGYRAFVEWQRGRHFRSIDEAREMYERETGMSSGMDEVAHG